MISAQEIADFYDFTESGDGFTGECPCCGYRGFSLTERDGRVLFYCHGGGCEQEDIIKVLREADLWGASDAESLFEVLDDQTRGRDREQEHLKDDNRQAQAALEIWHRSQPAEGTIVEMYLRARGYRGSIPTSLRYALGRHPSDDKLYPIMAAAVIRPDDRTKVIGIHRTFLRAGGMKAELDPNKMSLGPVRGGGVQLATPESKIAVSEGIETGLSFMQATGIPTWAALSAPGMKALLLPADVREVVIAADADEVGLKAAHEAAARWHAEGRRVRIVKPPAGLDFNDLARAP